MLRDRASAVFGRLVGYIEWCNDIPVVGWILAPPALAVILPMVILIVALWAVGTFVLAVAFVGPPMLMLVLIVEGAQLLADEYSWGGVGGASAAFAVWLWAISKVTDRDTKHPYG